MQKQDNKREKVNFVEVTNADGSTKKVTITKRIGKFKLKDLRQIKNELGHSLNYLIQGLQDDAGDVSAIIDLIYFLSSLSQLGVSYNQYLDYIENKSEDNFLSNLLEDTSDILDTENIEAVMVF